MPDIYMDVDTAVVVPVNVLPLLDDTDFKTIETAVVYNSAGLAVTWNFVTSAGVQTGTAITPTTAGVYDWSEPIADKGMYAIEIPASGGASANNDTEGYGWITGVATGVLPWRGPIIGFRRAAMNDLLVDGGTASTNLEDFFDGTGYAGGTAKLKVDVDTIKTQAVTCSGGVTIPAATLASTTNITAATGIVLSGVTHTGAVIPTVTTLTGHTAQTGDSFAIVNHVTYGNSALRNRGDAAWITATGFSTHAAADVWSVATRALTDKAGFSLTQTFPTNFADLAITAATGLVSLNLAQSITALTGYPTTVGGSLYFIRQLEKNKLLYNKTTDVMTLYEDDGTTPKGAHTMVDNATEATRGAGA